jgi:aminoglycoside phosphotransferase family enzyme/predicted kinase
MTLKRELMQPEAYGLSRATVELIETHLSWVFRLEHDVYKVKKPVDLGFLDFRTLAQRKAACDAELRLNRRLAKGVYLGVAPIVRTERGLRVSGQGTPVEWAVHMHRLSDAQRADLMLGRGSLTGALVDEIASCIAAFHQAAERSDEITRFGGDDVVRQNLLENFSQTAESIGEVLSQPEAAAIEAYQTAFLADHGPLFGARQHEGQVRDTHGDLRLEHIYLAPGKAPVVIDCIEFNDRFRYADVCADIAFLSMDLAVHGRADLAERLLARYARDTNDYDLYALVDFYESYRAFVRGKVSLMLASDTQAEQDTRQRARAEARRYFLFALAAGRPSVTPPFLLAVGGLIASGKSTVSEYVAAHAGLPVLGSDRTRKHLLGARPSEPLAGGPFAGAYDAERSAQTYRELLRRAELVLASGRPVIIDASFSGAQQRKQAKELARTLGVPFLFAECQSSDEAVRARLSARESQAGVSDARLPLLEAFRNAYEPVRELSAHEYMALDSEAALAQTAAPLLARLGLPAA